MYYTLLYVATASPRVSRVDKSLPPGALFFKQKGVWSRRVDCSGREWSCVGVANVFRTLCYD